MAVAPGAPGDGSQAITSPDRSAAVRDHLANERTLLAWQRTALALVGLGFVVDRFAFEGSSDKAILGTALGLAMIAGGGLTALVGVIRFRRVEAQIDADDYRPSLLAHMVFAGGLVVVSALLLLYLLLAKP
jgi:putative membrane protein